MKQLRQCVMVAAVAAILILAISCIQTPETFESGTLTFNLTGADEHEGMDFHYWVETFLPASRSLDDNKVLTGTEVIAGGEVHVTLEDPDNPGSDYVFKANNVVSYSVYIDADDNGENQGGIDWEMDDLLAGTGSGNIDGDKVINAVYPDDFHISGSGVPGITLLKPDYTMYWRYHQDENDLADATANVAKNFTLLISNTGGALVTLTGTPYVQLTGDTDVFSITTQPVSNAIIPGDNGSCIMTVLTATPGDYQAELIIPFDEYNNDDPDNSSPYKAIFNITVL